MSRPTPEITVDEFAAEREDGTTVDVRERGEYAQGFDAVSVAGGTRAWIDSGRAIGVGL
jgi:rhodanese-related sulfurtransferase